MTPQSATRKTRSQSPPQLTQRRPVSQMQAAMPRRSMTPYMCSVSGPRLKVPLDGDGIEARTTPVTAAHCARRRGRALLNLAQDPEGERGRAAALHERDRVVEIDIEPGCERDGIVSGETDAHQFAGAPALDALSFGLDDVGVVCRRHIRNLRISCSESAANWISPSGGICSVLLDGRAADQE